MPERRARGRLREVGSGGVGCGALREGVGGFVGGQRGGPSPTLAAALSSSSPRT